MSQINTNAIANELGTGGPDFVGMPSVGGDPVVESGSNSDGEWTRWADGTQQAWQLAGSSVTTNNGYGSVFRSGSVSFTFPAAFLTGSTPRVSHFVNQTSVDVAWPGIDAIPTATGTNNYAVSGASSVTARTGYLATGRWK